MGSTKVELVQDLEAKEPSALRDGLITQARAGVFHDYDSEHAAPKMLLRRALANAGYHDLAEKTIDGAYDDEEPTPVQAAELGALLRGTELPSHHEDPTPSEAETFTRSDVAEGADIHVGEQPTFTPRKGKHK